MTPTQDIRDLVTYDDFCQNLNIMADPNLVIKIDDKWVFVSFFL